MREWERQRDRQTEWGSEREIEIERTERERLFKVQWR